MRSASPTRSGSAFPRRSRRWCAARASWARPSAPTSTTPATLATRTPSPLEQGVVSLDASVGGAGGCPFAPKATGNIATEDLVYLLRGMGVETGIDLDALIECSHWLGQQLGKELPSMVSRAGDFPI